MIGRQFDPALFDPDGQFLQGSAPAWPGDAEPRRGLEHRAMSRANQVYASFIEHLPREPVQRGASVGTDIDVGLYLAGEGHSEGGDDLATTLDVETDRQPAVGQRGALADEAQCR